MHVVVRGIVSSALLALCSFGIVPVTLAAGSGTTVNEPQPVLEFLHTLAMQRSVDSRSDLVEKTEAVAALQKEKLLYEKELALKRTQCLTDIRRANRDTKLSVTLDCFRGDLLLQMSFLRTENAYLERLGGMSAGHKRMTIATNKDLSDAMATIVNAIDSGVYEEISALESAKQKLAQQYMTARYRALTAARAERTLGWIGLLGQRIQQLLPQAGTGELLHTRLLDSANCLKNTAQNVISVQQELQYESTKEKIGQYQSSLVHCIESLRSAIRISRGLPDTLIPGGSGGTKAGSGTSSMIKE